MKNAHELKSVSDDELLRRLLHLLKESRRTDSELVAHIAEVDERRLYARQASSMFTYCTEVLHLSEHEAYLRIAAARASRKFPVLLVMLGDGRLHLSGVAKLIPHLTETNSREVLSRAAFKSKRAIEELVAELAPKPDVLPSVRKLPRRPEPTSGAELGPDRVTNLPKSESTHGDKLAAPARERPALILSSRPPAPPVQPLAPARYKVQFTASAEFREKLERLTALMRSSIPHGDLAAILEDAVTEKLERLEAKRFAKTKAPRKRLEGTDTTPSSRRIPAAVKRAVVERDQNRCAFRDEKGRRCSERNRLEFHHHDPFGVGGDHSVQNISLRCRTHNQYQAERDYGKRSTHKFRNRNDRVMETGPGYFTACDGWISRPDKATLVGCETHPFD